MIEELGIFEDLAMDFVAIGVELLGDVVRCQLRALLPGNARANLARQGQ